MIVHPPAGRRMAMILRHFCTSGATVLREEMTESCATTAIHYNPHSNPSAFQFSKSYTLVGSLGNFSALSFNVYTGAQCYAKYKCFCCSSAQQRKSLGTRFGFDARGKPFLWKLLVPLLTIWPKSFVDLVYPSDFASNPILHHARHRYAHKRLLWYYR